MMLYLKEEMPLLERSSSSSDEDDLHQSSQCKYSLKCGVRGRYVKQHFPDIHTESTLQPHYLNMLVLGEKENYIRNNYIFCFDLYFLFQMHFVSKHYEIKLFFF